MREKYSRRVKESARAAQVAFGMAGPADFSNLCEIARLAIRYRTIAEADCNGVKTERQASHADNIEHKIQAIVGTWPDLRVKFEGDPRGFCVYLHRPENAVGNTWGGVSRGYGL